MPRKGRQPGAMMLQPTKETLRDDNRYWETVARDTQKKLKRAEAKLLKIEKALVEAMAIIQEPAASAATKSKYWGLRKK